MKVLALIRTHNSSWVINDTLYALTNNVDGIIIHDHNSTDDTVSICKKFEKVLEVFETKDSEYHEGRDKAILLNLGRKYNPDYFLIMDDDEIIGSDFRILIDNLMKTGFVYSFPLLYLWGGLDKVRVDGNWCKQFRTKLVPNTKELYFPMKKCHCSPHSIIQECSVDYPITHLGYHNEDKIKEKLDLYGGFSEDVNQMTSEELEEAFGGEPILRTPDWCVEHKAWRITNYD